MTNLAVDELAFRSWFDPARSNPSNSQPELTVFTDAASARVIIVGDCSPTNQSGPATFGWTATLANGTRFKSARYATATLALSALKTYIGST